MYRVQRIRGYLRGLYTSDTEQNKVNSYKRDSMEIKYVLDITKPYDNVLMMYGDHYQVQRYTQGIDTVSVGQWELENPNNGWIPDTTGTNLEGDQDRLYYLQDEMGSITKVIG